MNEDIKKMVIDTLLDNKIYKVNDDLEFKCIVNMLKHIEKYVCDGNNFGYAGMIGDKIIIFNIYIKDENTRTIYIHEYDVKYNIDDAMCIDDFTLSEIHEVIDELERIYKERQEQKNINK